MTNFKRFTLYLAAAISQISISNNLSAMCAEKTAAYAQPRPFTVVRFAEGKGESGWPNSLIQVTVKRDLPFYQNVDRIKRRVLELHFLEAIEIKFKSIGEKRFLVAKDHINMLCGGARDYVRTFNVGANAHAIVFDHGKFLLFHEDGRVFEGNLRHPTESATDGMIASAPKNELTLENTLAFSP